MLVAQLGFLIPGLSVGARRLHDTNRSGWWQLIALTIVGLIPLIIWFASDKDTMFMFPSWLMHWVPPTPVARVSISWNVILRGEYGEENTLQNANI